MSVTLLSTSCHGGVERKMIARLTLNLCPNHLCHVGKKVLVSHLESGSGVSLGLMATRSEVSSHAAKSRPLTGKAPPNGLSNHCLRKVRSIGLGPCNLVRTICLSRVSSLEC